MNVSETDSTIRVDPAYTASHPSKEKFSLNILMVPLGQMLRCCRAEGLASLKIPQACSFVGRNTHDSDVIGVEGVGARNACSEETARLFCDKAVWRRVNCEGVKECCIARDS
jgi:hypothetical protein